MHWSKPILFGNYTLDWHFLLLIICCVIGCWILTKAYQNRRQKSKDKALCRKNMHAIDHMTGEEFEGLLAAQFRQKGFRAETTPKSKDYGADLVMRREKKKSSFKRSVIPARLASRQYRKSLLQENITMQIWQWFVQTVSLQAPPKIWRKNVMLYLSTESDSVGIFRKQGVISNERNKGEKEVISSRKFLLESNDGQCRKGSAANAVRNVSTEATTIRFQRYELLRICSGRQCTLSVFGTGKRKNALCFGGRTLTNGKTCASIHTTTKEYFRNDCIQIHRSKKTTSTAANRSN